MVRSAVVAVLLLGCAGAAAAEEWPKAPGVLAPARRAVVRAALTESVVEVPVAVGDRVEAGQPLAQLDRRAAEIEAAIAEGNLEAAVQTARSGEGQVDARMGRVRRAEERLSEARARHDAGTSGADEVARAEEDRDAAIAAYEAASAEVDRLRVLARNAEALVARAHLALDRTVVAAPFAGVVAETFVVAGDSVLAHETPVVAIVDLSAFHVVVDVETDPSAGGRSVPA